MRTLLLLATLLSFTFCGSSGAIDQSADHLMRSNSDEKLADRIDYLFFRIQKDQCGNETVTFEKRMTSDGKLKGFTDSESLKINSGDLIVNLLDNSGKLIHQIKVNNPLKQNVESYDGEIKRHDIVLDKADFHVRFPYRSAIKKVEVQIQRSKENKLLLSHTF
ncbi:hypothetical protein J8J42_09505 [Chryseobacterium sp. cx-311]|uniref:hypothetical protein n=1 Tax=Marnyiella aurantia TaxID=2758037 RepID=UPI001AE29F85|nr:hypothetical protein [Marnyiella aurantia]MBP0613283.1 hypothetical protein [Marnyiella aurantia]